MKIKLTNNEPLQLDSITNNVSKSVDLARDILLTSDISDWAKASTKPTYTASEVGALPDSTVIPDELSDLTDDSTHRLVTDTEKSTWNGKQAALVSGTNIKTVNGNSLLGSGNVQVGEKFIVTVTGSSTLTSDKTYAEIVAAHNAGKCIEVIYNDYTYMPELFDTGEIYFYTMDGLTYCQLCILSDNSWENVEINVQSELVSGTSIKTVNDTALLGSGNIDADDVVMGKLDGSAFYKVTGYSGIQSTPSFSETAETGNADKVYVDIQTNKAYRWKRGILQAGENPYKLLSEELSVVTTSDISAVLPGTAKKAVSAKVLRDNFYTETEVDNALALKQNIDDVYVDQTYIDTNTTSSFSTANKRYNIATSITLTTSETYTFGAGCILHFYNTGMISGAANLELNNTQIEAPMKQCFDLNVNFNGLMRNSECYPEWWGAKGDGVTDDAAAINRCIYCACHTPVVLTAENYLVSTTVGPDYKVKNTAANTAAHTGWDGTYASQFIVKHNIIGDATLAGPVVRYATCYGLCRIDGTILVRNTSDDAVGFTTWAADGNLSCVNNEITIERIDKGTWPMNSLSSTAEGIGLGVGAALSCWDSKITIYNIRGFKEGCYMSRYGTNDLWVGRNECVYCFYLGPAKSAWYTGSPNWYVHRSKMTLGEQFAGLSSGTFVTGATDSSIIKENGAIEIAMNTWTVGDSNNATANCRHPHKHSLYYISGSAGHTGNHYKFNITYAIETSRDFIKFEHSSAPTATNGRQGNGDVIEFGVSCYMKDINAPYGWNVHFKNVIISNTAKTKGSYRWMGGTNEILLDDVTLSYKEAPIWTNGTNPIKILTPNEQFKGKVVAVDSAPATCADATLYVVDDPITTNGTKKYPVYCKYFGTDATLVGYVLDNYKEKQDALVSGTNIKTINGSTILTSGNVDTKIPQVDVSGGTVSQAMDTDKLYIFGSTSTPCTS